MASVRKKPLRGARVGDPSKRAGGPTNRDELENLRRAFPNKKGVRLRRSGEPSKRKARAATLWLYLERDDGVYQLHETVFAKQEQKSDSWWSQYFETRVFKGWGRSNDNPVKRLGIIGGGILPGIYVRTRMSFHVRAIIGYCLHDNVRAVYPEIYSPRHQA